MKLYKYSYNRVLEYEVVKETQTMYYYIHRSNSRVSHVIKKKYVDKKSPKGIIASSVERLKELLIEDFDNEIKSLEDNIKTLEEQRLKIESILV